MTTTNRNRGRRLLGLAATVAVIVAIFAWRFAQLGGTAGPDSIRAVQAREGLPVQTVAVTRGDLERWITLAGTVEGRIQYPIVSNNALQVLEIPVSEGERVVAGQVIIRLASGAPSPMYHSLDRTRASYDNALDEVKRLRNLFAEGAVSESALDQAETRLRVQSAELQDAEGSTLLVATEAGLVTSILVTVGETVSTGKPLAWVADAAEVDLVFAAGSGQALVLGVGQAAQWLAGDGAPGGDGTVSALDLMANPTTHLLSGKASFANPLGRLVPGMLVSLRVRTEHRTAVLLVPKGSLVTHEGQPAVWVADLAGAEAKAVLRSVTVGLDAAGQVEILSGLAEGDQVIRYGQTLLEAGARIKPAPAGEES